MATLFVSHASKDDALTDALEAWLRANGFTDLFVDHHSIAGGDKWREALRTSAASCRVVICLVTPNWLASDECFGEFVAANYIHGKRIIPLFLLPPESEVSEGAGKRLAKVCAEDQGINLGRCIRADGALDLDADDIVADRLKAGLRAAGALADVGLDPEAFAIDRSLRPIPFPGLASFGDSDADAAIFYGRSREIALALEELRKMRAEGDVRPFVILGASGAGKSSLLKAGIIPRLRRETPAWLPLRAFRPGADPLLNFSEALAKTYADFGKSEPDGVIRLRLFNAWSGAERDDSGEFTAAGFATLGHALAAEGRSLRDAAGRAGASILVSVDQAEEIGRAEDDRADVLADYLRAALITPEANWQLAFAIRADSLPELQVHRRFRNLEARGYDLRALPAFRYASVIEEPARRYGVTVDAALVDALMEDTPNEDALPLLAFALERMWRRYGTAGVLTKHHYDRAVTALIEDAAERALRGLEPEQDVPLPSAPPAKALIDLAASTFVPALVQLNEQGAATRRVADLTSFRDEQKEMLGRFLRWRLVVLKVAENGGGTVEVAHEALFREWARLREWLEPERARLEALRSLHVAADAWNRNERTPGFLDHRDKRLSEAGALAESEGYRNRLGAVEFDYLAACRASERATRRRTRRVQALIGVLAVGIVAGLAAWWQDQWLKERYHWFANVRGHVLTAEKERALKPGEPFRECAETDSDYSKHCPEMVVVPAGSFGMGSPDGEGEDTERPRHQVRIDRPFTVSKYEVTFDQWDACVTYGRCPRASDVWGRGRRPVIDVSWHDAKQYVKWLSELTGQDYRLLSEAEWEYAARAKTDTRYSFGDDGAALGEHAWYSLNSDSRTHPVGERKPNGFGLHDMHGNVSEWVEDNYHLDYKGDPPADGSVWQGGDQFLGALLYGSLRVLRGGSWSDYQDRLRSAIRSGNSPTYRNSNVGFRVARTLLPLPSAP
jgi:formylglycine-generating enzyme required for sulfatase activity